MTKNYKTRDLVSFVREHAERWTEQSEMMADAEMRFPGVTIPEMQRAFEVLQEDEDDKFREVQREFAQGKAFREQGKKMFDGLPDSITFGEAVEIKAAQGNQWAIAYLAQESTPARRTYCALANAAYAAHPQFEQHDNGVIYWLGGEGDGPSEAALIDWFQKTHPAEARAIERAIEKESA